MDRDFIAVLPAPEEEAPEACKEAYKVLRPEE